MIEAVIVGRYDGRLLDDNALPDENVVLSREDGLRKLDQEFVNGFGRLRCSAMYAWTKTRVFLVHEYESYVELGWVPRNPQPIAPEFGGNSCE